MRLARNEPLVTSLEERVIFVSCHSSAAGVGKQGDKPSMGHRGTSASENLPRQKESPSVD